MLSVILFRTKLQNINKWQLLEHLSIYWQMGTSLMFIYQLCKKIFEINLLCLVTHTITFVEIIKTNRK